MQTERDPDTVRGPDVCYYSYARVPKGPLPPGLLPAAADLVFEVRSPNDRWADLHAKTAEYLNAGVQTVCVVDDDSKSVHIFHANKPPQVLAVTDRLALPEILPGFDVPVDRIFE